jgi:hypothetical protein
VDGVELGADAVDVALNAGAYSVRGRREDQSHRRDVVRHYSAEDVPRLHQPSLGRKPGFDALRWSTPRAGTVASHGDEADHVSRKSMGVQTDGEDPDSSTKIPCCSSCPPSRRQCGDDHSTFGSPLGRDRRVTTIPPARSSVVEALVSRRSAGVLVRMGACTTIARPVATAKPTIAATQARPTVDHQERVARSAADGVATTESPGCASSGVGQLSAAPGLRERELLSGCICSLSAGTSDHTEGIDRSRSSP